MSVRRDRFDAALADRLHRLDDEREQAAAARAWTAVRAAYDARDPLAAGRAAGGDAHRDAAAWAGTDGAAGGGARGRGRRGASARRGARRARRWGVALLVALGGAALALGPAGAKVGDWIGRTFDPPAGRALPADGRLLVSDPTGAWIVQRDLSARWLGAWSTASWSPRGLFVLATRRDLLAALDPRGQVRWTLSRPHVSHAIWSRGDGYRVAYRSRRQLRVVAGDGSGDRALAARTAAVTPAWRPGPAHDHVLAYATPRGGVVVRDVDAVASWEGPTPRPAGWLPSGAPAPALAVPVRRGKPVRAIAWAGRDRLLVLRRDRLDLLALDGRRLATARPPWPGFLGGNLAVGPDGRVAAFVAFDRVRGASELRTVRLDPPPSRRAGGASGIDRPVRLRARMRFAGPGGFGEVAISPDGRWAGVWWPAGDRWVFARTTGPRRVTAVGRVSRRLDPGTRARASVAGSPVGVSGWMP
ncbi:hypothetical protein [Conexibacter arvalis]|uniref:WD40 repeat domain-containing protein n=1 Tax=Conexibacter arvalis TaxID=912552 RepID=A0A840IM48_9ACTN|nr:hypothetical protein [Conexibacter arvalis]MBB4665018.1 hypothetical protein [Conexibacter arvalis]